MLDLSPQRTRSLGKPSHRLDDIKINPRSWKRELGWNCLGHGLIGSPDDEEYVNNNVTRKTTRPTWCCQTVRLPIQIRVLGRTSQSSMQQCQAIVRSPDQISIRNQISWLSFPVVFLSLQGNAGMKPQIKPRPLPSTTFPSHYSLIIVSFRLLKVPLNKE
jgi:hypothetical protein